MVPEPSLLLEGNAQQEARQLPAAGEFAQFIALSN